MKIAVFSDTHNKHKKISLPQCDIAIFAGDATSLGQKHEMDSFLKWYGKQEQCTHKILVAGNHDRSFDSKFFYTFEDHDLFEENFPKGKPGWLLERLDYQSVSNNLYYLENSFKVVEGLKIWGSPITPSFHRQHWAFNADRNEEIRKYWDLIPTDADIVITHGPVYGKLDYVPESQEFTGCVDLKDKIESVAPKIFICGHIHSGRGVSYDGKTLYVNSAIVDNSYQIQGDPMIIEFDVEKRKVGLFDELEKVTYFYS